MMATRLVCVNGVYFKYPVDISLNDGNFLMALLTESKQANPDTVHIAKKDDTGFVIFD